MARSKNLADLISAQGHCGRISNFRVLQLACRVVLFGSGSGHIKPQWPR